MLETLLDKKAAWLSGDGPEADIVVGCRGRLVRNLADFAFSRRCSDYEKQAVEDRVLAAIRNAGMLAHGEYHSLVLMEPGEGQFLRERQLVGDETLRAKGAGGVFVQNDQSASIMVNAQDHLRFQVMTPGLQLPELWQRLSETDDALGASLYYAFNERLGFLVSALAEVGTTLRLSALLHLPGLGMKNELLRQAQDLREKDHLLKGFFGPLGDGLGDMYLLTNRSTLGRSEEELLFGLKHEATRLIDLEREARQEFYPKGTAALEDRVGRALGIARGARLMDFQEGIQLLSSLRLGRTAGEIDAPSNEVLNDLMFALQPAHLAMRLGVASDELTISMERASLFRNIFS